MTPDWLYKHSTITKPFTVYPNHLEIPNGTGKENGRIIQAELVAPNILTATDSVVVTLTISMDTALPDSGSDYDPIFGISDGTTFIGFQAVDKGNYGSTSPCFEIEGDIANAALKNMVYSSGTKTNSEFYSSEIKIQIKPNDQWGSCHTEHDGGRIRIGNYQRKLNFTKSAGLYFEMYRSGTNEKYNILCIQVDIHLE